MDISIAIDWEQVAGSVGLPVGQVRRCADLLDEGNTVAFVTRYRKDHTNGLDEQQIFEIQTQVELSRALEAKKQKILRSIDSQGRLTSDLTERIRTAPTAKLLDDLYMPFKPKKETLATKARERGLGPLADSILAGKLTGEELEARVMALENVEQRLPTAADVLRGVGHLLSEHYSEHAGLRGRLRKPMWRNGVLACQGIEQKDSRKLKQQQAFKNYVDFREPLSRTPPHRVLAINRGEREGVLRVKVEVDVDAMHELGCKMLVPPDHPHADRLRDSLRDALCRLLLPSLEREVRRELAERAEVHAVDVFARNLRNLLLQPPVVGHRLLAVDPGFRSGCKLAVLDQFGNVESTDIIYLLGNDEQRQASRDKLASTISERQVSVVAIGNGTACRETETLVADVLEKELAETDISYVIVNEAGASVYSTSELGREEMPALDATQRSTVSIGRRLLDPLSELVKINPANIGVGLYQHDLKGKHLQASLDAVVESCVNYVGVDLNTASPALLRYVSGLNQLTARRIYDYRSQHGPFKSRLELQQVPGIGDAVFIQSAGFLKITQGDNPLDATSIHPESYAVAEQALEKMGSNLDELGAPSQSSTTSGNGQLLDRFQQLPVETLADQLGVGVLTLRDILDDLCRPGRDPRENLPPPVFRRGIIRLEDLKPGMELSGTVLNVVDFGVFVDIGLHNTGLVHISRLADRYIRDAHEVVSVGQVLKVWVVEIDKDRRRVSLTAIPPGTKKQIRPRRSDKKHPRGTHPRTKTNRPEATSTRPAAREKPRRKARPQQPAVPITKAMKEGHEPMRTFGDLKQFYEKTNGQNDKD